MPCSICARCLLSASVFMAQDSLSADEETGDQGCGRNDSELGTQVWSPPSLGSSFTCSWGREVTPQRAWRSLSPVPPTPKPCLAGGLLGMWSSVNSALKFQMVLWAPRSPHLGWRGTGVMVAPPWQPSSRATPPSRSWSCSANSDQGGRPCPGGSWCASQPTLGHPA